MFFLAAPVGRAPLPRLAPGSPVAARGWRVGWPGRPERTSFLYPASVLAGQRCSLYPVGTTGLLHAVLGDTLGQCGHKLHGLSGPSLPRCRLWCVLWVKVSHQARLDFAKGGEWMLPLEGRGSRVSLQTGM